GRWPGLWIASIAMTLGIFTTGCGFALIGVGILGLAGYGLAQKRVPWLQLMLFVLVSSGCTAVYLRGYRWPGYSATSLARLHPLEMASYFVTYVGSPFWIRSAAHRSCQVFGCAGLMSMAAAAYYTVKHARDWISTALPWMLLACYTLINAADTAFARIDFGVEQATASRYRPIAILFWVALVAMLAMIAYQVRTRFSRRVLVAASLAVIFTALTGY